MVNAVTAIMEYAMLLVDDLLTDLDFYLSERIPIRYLQKRYELLKGLLKANLVSFSDSQWASPIVIVLKRNGEDIQLCIDYKVVNAVTAIMEYADALLTNLDSYIWFCSLDAASGFWAIMMTHRARKISAFVYPLGHFEWLRMPFGLKNAPMIYQRMIDNALWGFVQPKGVWRSFADKMKAAEDLAKSQKEHSAEHSAKSCGEPLIVNTKLQQIEMMWKINFPILKL
ncbi:reverse transcriptase [Phytophthora megakarya]|uniref:Reverse transcriptase n=1 Tax=Phytophthora megakarya TaxID=4795 RepID=A0A225WDM1_9STRA|nr:reverse transcriptase [Phytophthora megakarya]